jgi:hypothetical protein
MCQNFFLQLFLHLSKNPSQTTLELEASIMNVYAF